MLMTGGIQPPTAWLIKTLFTSYFIPGLLLSVVVGGSDLLNAIVYAVDRHYASLLALTSGTIMCAWIIDEIALIQTYYCLQLLYFMLGGLVVGLTYTESKHVFIYRHKA